MKKRRQVIATGEMARLKRLYVALTLELLSWRQAMINPVRLSLK
nr:hypothetical protein [Sphingobacterium sp. 40-24]